MMAGAPRRPLAADPAALSGAGDEFHVLWAARQALRLIDPNSDAKALHVESLAIDDLDDADDRMLGVDLTAYFGGSTFDEAAAVEVTQLKYSTRHPGVPWTAARLARGRSRRGANSVLRRLADAYSLYADRDRALVLDRLQVRLVSNQPIDAVMSEILAVASSVPRHEVLTVRELRRRLPSDAEAMVATLHRASDLKSAQFGDFIRILDCSGCGQGSRALQGLAVFQGAAPFLGHGRTMGITGLIALVAAQAQPDRVGRALTAADVRAALGVEDEADLFPSPPLFHVPSEVVRTRDIAAISSAMSSAVRQLLVHGSAGSGKTTSLLALPSTMDGLEMVVFDTFGDGTYADDRHDRHTPFAVLTQIANELGSRGLCDFLLIPPTDLPSMWRQFERRLRQAAAAAAARRDLIVIAVDAADNGAVRARERREPSLFGGLWSLPLPDNVRLVVTCRTHRRHLLDPPAAVEQMGLAGFDLAETTTNFRTSFPDASVDNVSEFHEATAGNPRVQAYALAKAVLTGGGAGAATALGHKSPETLFDDLVSAARDVDAVTADRRLADLVCLTRPLRLRHIADAWQVAEHEAEDFLAALSPGLTMRHGRLAFRDEDFDTYLRDRITPEDLIATHARLADYYEQKASADPHAAEVVAEHLAGARREADLLSLAEREFPAGLLDPPRRARVRQRRAALALRVSRGRGLTADVPRLLVLAASAARTDTALAELVRRDPALAGRYMPSEDVAAIYARADRSSWVGARLLQTAAMVAREPESREAADGRLNDAEAWIRTELAVGDPPRLALEADDIAAGVEAVYWLSGAEAAYRWLRQWRPKRLYRSVVQRFAERLAPNIDGAEIADSLVALGAHPQGDAYFAAALARAGRPGDERLVQRALAHLRRPSARRWVSNRFPAFSEDAQEWLADLADSAVAVNSTASELACLAALVPLPSTPVRDWDGGGEWTTALRIRAAIAVLDGAELPPIDELMAAVPRPEPAFGDYDRRRLRDWLDLMAPIILLRARALAGMASTEEARAAIERATDSLRATADHRWYRAERRYRRWPVLAAMALRHMDDANSQIAAVADLVPSLLGPWAAETWTAMSATLAGHPGTGATAASLLDRTARSIETSDSTASERTDLYLACARVAVRIEDGLARDFFRSALAAAEGVDDDRALLLGLAARAATSSAGEHARGVAVAMRDTTDGIRRYVSDGSVIPLSEVQASLARLDPAISLSSAAVWADEGIAPLEDSIETIASTLIETGVLRSDEALELLTLAGDDLDLGRLGVQVLDEALAGGLAARPRLIDASDRIAAGVLRDMPIEQRAAAAARLLDWAQTNELTHLPAFQRLTRFRAFFESLPANLEDGHRPTLATFVEEDEVGVHGSHEAFDRGDFAGLELHLAELTSARYRPGVVEDCLRSMLINATTLTHRLAFLQAVAGLWLEPGSRGFEVEAKISIVAEASQAWRHLTSVRDWLRHGIPALVSTNLSALVRYAPYELSVLESASNLPGLDPDTLADAVVEGVVTSQHDWKPTQYVALADLLARRLPPDERRGLSQWVLGLLQRELGAPSRVIHPVDVATDLDDALGGFLVAVLGSHDRRERGRAVHAALGLVAARGPSLVQRLVSELDASHHADGFRSARLEAFRLSSRVGLLFTLAHLAARSPSLLRSHVETFAAAALDPGYPHAQARELARRAAMSLETAHPGGLDPPVLERLRAINRPATQPERRGHIRTDDSRRLDGKFMFSFDSLDVLPYWYEPLARLFEVTTADVAARAQRWIVDRWGFSDDDWWRDPRELRDRDGRNTRPDHGGIPRYEVLRTYLEFHALQMAAGELADERPVVRRRWESWDPWQEWLGRWLDSDPEFLLASWRSPTPFLPPSFGEIISPLDTRLPAEYFDQFVGLDEEPIKRVAIAGWISVDVDREHQSVRIESALVSPVNAMALVSALETAPDPREWALPILGNRGSLGDLEVSHGAYFLRPWVFVEERDRGALEEHDPLARSVRYAIEHPKFTSRGSAPRSGARDLVVDRADQAQWLEVWSDERLDGSDRLQGEGRRMWIDADAGRRMLRRRRAALMVVVKVSGYRRELGERDIQYGTDQAHVYLFGADGSLRELDRDRRFGETDRLRTRAGSRA